MEYQLSAARTCTQYYVSMASLKAELPSREVVAIDFPGYVRDLQTALQVFGGNAGVLKAISSSSSILPLHFRCGDAYSHPSFGERHTSRGVVLRLKRSKSKEAPDISAQLVAKVNGVFQFPGTADFQLVADTTLPIQEDGPLTEKLEAVYGSEAEPLLTLPPLFTRLDIPMDYHFRSFYGEDAPSLRGPGNAKTKGQLPAHVMKLSVLSVPPPIQASDLVEGSYKAEKRELLRKLFALFAERPSWCAAALQDKLQTPRLTLNELEASLPRVAYIFRAGPFAHMWMRRGHDPRQDSKNRIYQAVAYSLPPGWHQKLSNSNADTDDEQAREAALPPVARSYKEMCSFRAVPKQQTVYLQLCDLEDAKVASCLPQGNKAVNAFNNESGWFAPAELDRFSRQVAARFQTLLKRSDPKRGLEESHPEESAAVSEPATGLDAVDMEVDGASRPGASGLRHGSADTDAEWADRVAITSDRDVGAAHSTIIPAGVLENVLANWTPAAPELLESQTDPGRLDGVGDVEDNAEYEIFEDETDEEEDDDEDMDDEGEDEPNNE